MNCNACCCFNSGESMENALRACCKGIKIGKILIHREGDNGKQVAFSSLLGYVYCHIIQLLLCTDLKGKHLQHTGLIGVVGFIIGPCFFAFTRACDDQNRMFQLLRNRNLLKIV